MPKIVVVGSFNTDLVVYMPELPRFGETVSGHRFVTGPGGKGSNQAVGAARLGAEVVFIGRVGNDGFATTGLKMWESEGINTKYIIKDEHNPTGIASIFVEDSGENMIALALGANLALSPADIDSVATAFEGANVLLTQLEVPQETAFYAIKLARARGITTILNPAPVKGPLPNELLALADYVTPNETEIEALSGNHSGMSETLARKLVQNDRQKIVITLGDSGAMWVGQQEHGHVPAFVVEAIDTVGGGDAFNAGLAVALSEAKPLSEAVLFANATAALAVTRKGAAASMPKRAEVDAFIAEHRNELTGD